VVGHFGFQAGGTFKPFYSAEDDKLSEFMRHIAEGQYKLPNFQRQWVWEDQQVQKLISSVCAGEPIGSLMLMKRGATDFGFRPFYGADDAPGEPSHLVMDGQQRLTALFNVFFQHNPFEVREKSKRALRKYYINLEALARDPDNIIDSIVSVRFNSEGKQQGTYKLNINYADNEHVIENKIIPLSTCFELTSYDVAYTARWLGDAIAMKCLSDFKASVIQRLNNAEIPYIEMKGNADLKLIARVYEKMNSTGTALEPFDLLIARFASQNVDLHGGWFGTKSAQGASVRINRAVGDLVGKVVANQYLQSVRHYMNLEKGSAESGVTGMQLLEIGSDDYARISERVVVGYELLKDFLNSINVLVKRDSPPSHYITAIAAILGKLQSDPRSHRLRECITKWINITSNSDRSHGSDATFASDVVEVAKWVEDSSFSPTFLKHVSVMESSVANVRSSRFLTALMISKHARDFALNEEVSNRTYVSRNYDTHHIFPAKWCQREGIPKKLYDSIYNKTPLAPRTNREMISDRPPSIYTAQIEASEGINRDTMDDILRSCLIDPVSFRSDDFYSFIARRRQSMLECMKEAFLGTFVEEESFLGERPKRAVVPSYRDVLDDVEMVISQSTSSLPPEELLDRVHEKLIENSIMPLSSIDDAKSIDALARRVDFARKLLAKEKKISVYRGVIKRNANPTEIVDAHVVAPASNGGYETVPPLRVLTTVTLRILREAPADLLTVSEIEEEIVNRLQLTEAVRAIPHKDPLRPQAEYQYQAAWARTTLRNAGLISNPEKNCWRAVPSAGSGDAEADVAYAFVVKRMYETFTFDKAGIELGSVLEFAADNSFKAVVSGPKTVSFEGAELPLAKAAWICRKKLGLSAPIAAGHLDWHWNGKPLISISG